MEKDHTDKKRTEKVHGQPDAQVWRLRRYLAHVGLDVQKDAIAASWRKCCVRGV